MGVRRGEYYIIELVHAEMLLLAGLFGGLMDTLTHTHHWVIFLGYIFWQNFENSVVFINGKSTIG